MQQIDREQVCAAKEEICVLVFSVVCRAHGGFEIIKFKVRLSPLTLLCYHSIPFSLPSLFPFILPSLPFLLLLLSLPPLSIAL